MCEYFIPFGPVFARRNTHFHNGLFFPSPTFNSQLVISPNPVRFPWACFRVLGLLSRSAECKLKPGRLFRRFLPLHHPAASLSRHLESSTEIRDAQISRIHTASSRNVLEFLVSMVVCLLLHEEVLDLILGDWSMCFYLSLQVILMLNY